MTRLSDIKTSLVSLLWCCQTHPSYSTSPKLQSPSALWSSQLIPTPYTIHSLTFNPYIIKSISPLKWMILLQKSVRQYLQLTKWSTSDDLLGLRIFINFGLFHLWLASKIRDVIRSITEPFESTTLLANVDKSVALAGAYISTGFRSDITCIPTQNLTGVSSQ